MKIDSENVEWRIIDDEAVILSLNHGFYYSFNKTGTEIWKFLSEEKNKEDIVFHIADKYGISQDKVEQDVDEFLEFLSKEKLIK